MNKANKLTDYVDEIVELDTRLKVMGERRDILRALINDIMLDNDLSKASGNVGKATFSTSTRLAGYNVDDLEAVHGPALRQKYGETIYIKSLDMVKVKEELGEIELEKFTRRTPTERLTIRMIEKKEEDK